MEKEINVILINFSFKIEKKINVGNFDCDDFLVEFIINK